MSFIGTSIILNGEIAPIMQQKPYGIEKEVYEVFRVENGRPLFLGDHLARFENSIRKASVELPLSVTKLKELIEWLIVCNPSTNANIRLCLLPDGTFQAGFIRSKYPDAKMYKEGVRCLLLNRERANPSAKVFQADMRREAAEVQKEQNVYETVLVNRDGKITEGSRSNIFFVKGEILITAPSEMVLEGIMRSKVIECASKCNVTVEYKAIQTSDLNKMDAAFISGTSPRILPVKEIGDIIFDVNNRTMRILMEELDKLIHS